MKKAVILTGGKQYLVSEGEVLEVDLIKDQINSLNYTPLLVINGDKMEVGKPEVSNAKVTAEIVEEDIKGEKVTAIRYKAKKRVHKVRGHRQHHTVIKIKNITI